VIQITQGKSDESIRLRHNGSKTTLRGLEHIAESAAEQSRHLPMWSESHYPLWTRPIVAASKRHARQFAGR